MIWHWMGVHYRTSKKCLTPKHSKNFQEFRNVNSICQTQLKKPEEENSLGKFTIFEILDLLELKLWESFWERGKDPKKFGQMNENFQTTRSLIEFFRVTKCVREHENDICSLWFGTIGLYFFIVELYPDGRLSRSVLVKFSEKVGFSITLAQSSVWRWGVCLVATNVFFKLFVGKVR